MPPKSLHIAANLSFGGFQLKVEEDIRLEGIVALFGPSGSGKSTLLRVIAGLERGNCGRIAFGDQVWADSSANVFVPPHQRSVGLVFQDGRLFAHLTVDGNLRYAARRSVKTRKSISFEGVVEALDLKDLLCRSPATLSGGERQRAALGRTLLSQPDLLLLDEPMSALDVRRKGELLPFIEKVPQAFGVPMIFVSHAVDEVIRLADEAIILVDGKVSGRGPLPEIFQQAGMHGLTGNFEAGSVVDATVVEQDAKYQLTAVKIGGETLWMPMVSSLPCGEDVRLRIRARDVSLATCVPKGISIRNCLPAHVTQIDAEPDTAFAEVMADIGGQAIRARITRHAADELGLKRGMKAYVLIKSVSFDRRVLISSRR